MSYPSPGNVAISLAEFTEPDLELSLEEVVRLGVNHVELWIPRHATVHTARAVGNLLERRGLRTACVSSPSYLHGDESGQGARLIGESIEIAQVLGAPFVNTYFGHGGDGDDTEAAHHYARCLSGLLWRAELVNVTIVLENEFDAFGHDPDHVDISRRPEALKQLVDIVGSPNFKLNFDAANFRCVGEDAAAAACALAPDVAYVHVKDVVELRKGRNPDPGWKRYSDGDRVYQSVQLGQGEVPWARILKTFNSVGFHGFFTLEPHCEADNLVAELQASLSYLLNGFGR